MRWKPGAIQQVLWESPTRLSSPLPCCPWGFSLSFLQKNDQEKELVLLQRAHRQQQAALRRCREEVARTKGLEEMVRQQEKVSRGGLGMQVCAPSTGSQWDP